MKTLQNNFTTPEQSKRLLELGVPADSADCYCNEYGTVNIWKEEYDVKTYLGGRIPCWSVGRLIEIMQICKLNGCGWDLFYQKFHLINKLMDIIETYNSRLFDFSKLEE